jgi:hypothetical protein
VIILIAVHGHLSFLAPMGASADLTITLMMNRRLRCAIHQLRYFLEEASPVGSKLYLWLELQAERCGRRYHMRKLAKGALTVVGLFALLAGVGWGSCK